MSTTSKTAGTKKTKKHADSNTLILFYSHTPSKSGVLGVECFSQFYPTPNFTIDNIKFPTSEHWMHYMKAKLFGDAKIMKEMLLEKNSDPAKAKKLGRKVVPFDEKVWTENAYKIVVEGNFHKFSQNEDLKKVLLDTKDAILAEASPKDAIWGIGMSKSNKDAKDPSKWQGTNLLGKALMEVRHRLIGGAGGEYAGDDMSGDGGGSGTAGPAGPAGGRTRSSSPPPSSTSDVVLHPYLVNVNNRSNDFNTFINHLLLGIYENDKHRQIIVSDKYLKIWETVFLTSGGSSEKNDILGEKLYSCALVKLIYAQRNGSITPSEISNMNIYFSSSAFLETIAVRLGFEKWNKTTPPSGLVSTFKRFIFTLEYISDLIRDDYRKVGDFETAASMPSGFTVVERFIDTYFKVTNEDFIKAVRKPAKTFIIQISDLFNFKGRWAIVSSTASGGGEKYYTFKIYDKELVSQKILETFFGKRPNLKDKERYANARRIINEELDSSGSDDETKLANQIAEKINSFGLTYDWLEKYRNVLRIENIPESLKNLLKDTIKNLGYDSVVFEYSESHSHEERKSGVKIGVVIMFGLKNRSKHLLFTDSGEIFNENYTFLKNKTIESWIKSLVSA